MSVMCLSDVSHWPATTAVYQKKKKNSTETCQSFLIFTHAKFKMEE